MVSTNRFKSLRAKRAGANESKVFSIEVFSSFACDMTSPNFIMFSPLKGLCVPISKIQDSPCLSYALSGERFLPFDTSEKSILREYMIDELAKIDDIFTVVEGGVRCREALKSQFCQTLLPPCVHTIIKNPGKQKGTPDKSNPVACTRKCLTDEGCKPHCTNVEVARCQCGGLAFFTASRPCRSSCTKIRKSCQSVADKVPPSYLSKCDAVFPEVESSSYRNFSSLSRGEATIFGLSSWESQPVFPELYMTLSVSGGNGRTFSSDIPCYEPLIMQPSCNVTEMSSMCPLPFISVVNETDCLAECKLPCPSPVYDKVDGYDTILPHYIIFGILAFVFNGVVLASEVREVAKQGRMQWLIFLCSFLGTLWVMMAVFPAAFESYDVFCGGSNVETDAVSDTWGCAISKFSIFILQSFIFAVACSLASFYYKLKAGILFQQGWKQEKIICIGLILGVPAALAIACSASEVMKVTEENLAHVRKEFGLSILEVRMLLSEYRKVLSVESVRGAFVCNPKLPSLGTEVVLIHLPLIIGVLIALVYSFRTRNLLKQVMDFRRHDNVNEASMALEKRAAKRMSRFALACAVFVTFKVVSMVWYFPQLQSFSDTMQEYAFCVFSSAFKKTGYASIQDCVLRKGSHHAHECFAMASKACRNPLSSDAPSAWAARVAILCTAALPLVFGMMFSHRVFSDCLGWGKKRVHAKPSHATDQSSAHNTSAEATSKTESD